MSTILKIHKTYKYRLFTSKQDFFLHEQLNIAGMIWNHITALQKRYYRRYKKHISENRIQKHIARLRMKTNLYHHWKKLGSQSVQEICQRHESSYQRFFNKKGNLPRFKKISKFGSFVLKQYGWKLGVDSHKRGSSEKPKWTGHIIINNIAYKFVKHRPLSGIIKTITIKRDKARRLWICFSVLDDVHIEAQSSMSKIGGFDFGLRTFLTSHDGQVVAAPEFFKADLPRLRQIQRQVSKKIIGSINRKEGIKHLARRQIRISDKRRNFHYQLAHTLCNYYDVLIFESLNIEGMKRFWGRKVSDLGFKTFLNILEWVAFKRGKRLIFIDRWERTTGKCSSCGYLQKIGLKEVIFLCENCGFQLNRDHNAAKNIFALGHQRILQEVN